jgi:hypothetical protein
MVTATEVCGRFPQADVAASNRADPWDGSGFLRLGATGVSYVATPCPYGGGRFWFLCPNCARSVFKLYAPPPGEVYACWRCHDLTYQSRQQGHGALDQLFRALRAVSELAPLLKKRGRRSKRYYRLVAHVRALDGVLGGVRRVPL